MPVGFTPPVRGRLHTPTPVTETLTGRAGNHGPAPAVMRESTSQFDAPGGTHLNTPYDDLFQQPTPTPDVPAGDARTGPRHSEANQREPGALFSHPGEQSAPESSTPVRRVARPQPAGRRTSPRAGTSHRPTQRGR